MTKTNVKKKKNLVLLLKKILEKTQRDKIAVSFERKMSFPSSEFFFTKFGAMDEDNVDDKVSEELNGISNCIRAMEAGELDVNQENYMGLCLGTVLFLADVCPKPRDSWDIDFVASQFRVWVSLAPDFRKFWAQVLLHNMHDWHQGSTGLWRYVVCMGERGQGGADEDPLSPMFDWQFDSWCSEHPCTQRNCAFQESVAKEWERRRWSALRSGWSVCVFKARCSVGLGLRRLQQDGAHFGQVPMGLTIGGLRHRHRPRRLPAFMFVEEGNGGHEARP